MINNLISQQIWEDRYKKNGETFEDSLMRVAKYIGTNDKEVNDFYNVMRDGLFYPAGRTMSNSGIGKILTLNNCFTKGHKVLAKDGYKEIQNVKIGDYVLTHDNTFQRVNDVMERDYEGDLYELDVLFSLDKITCTPNHQFLTDSRGWVEAKDLQKESDKLKLTNNTNDEDLYSRIKDVKILENQQTKVYNLSVENTHSYNVNGVIVHNCFTLNLVPDSMEGIFDYVKFGALTQKAGGGTGYNFSLLRPKDTPTSNDAVASGVVSFMNAFDSQTHTVLQGSRRGYSL